MIDRCVVYLAQGWCESRIRLRIHRFFGPEGDRRASHWIAEARRSLLESLNRPEDELRAEAVAFYKTILSHPDATPNQKLRAVRRIEVLMGLVPAPAPGTPGPGSRNHGCFEQESESATSQDYAQSGQPTWATASQAMPSMPPLPSLPSLPPLPRASRAGAGAAPATMSRADSRAAPYVEVQLHRESEQSSMTSSAGSEAPGEHVTVDAPDNDQCREESSSEATSDSTITAAAPALEGSTAEVSTQSIVARTVTSPKARHASASPVASTACTRVITASRAMSTEKRWHDLDRHRSRQTRHDRLGDQCHRHIKRIAIQHSGRGPPVGAIHESM
ncbi:MAG: hypothetical protein JJU36_07035 [Phycisphaeraceae bacterium]|nr:hypothetical protein [Phycisphaeraceae bacterium]